MRLTFVALIAVLSSLATTASAQPSDTADAVCPRPSPGAVVSNPPELRSRNGVLETTLTFKAAVDATGLNRYCYINDSGLQAPTLRVKPGDLLIIHLRNAVQETPAVPSEPATHIHAATGDAACADGSMSSSSTNLHFHGMNLPPTCHHDDVIHTAIRTGSTFDYRIRIPANHPPGLYWYHPHIHGSSQRQLQGGASGALIVEGAQAINSSLVGLPERILVIRDQSLFSARQRQSTAPSADISVNYAPVPFPQYQPATILVKPSERQFWRVVNAAANTMIDLQFKIRGAPQTLQVFSIDGVPIHGGLRDQDHILLGPGARAEFVLTTAAAGEPAQLITRKWDTGPAGESHPQRPLADLVAKTGVQESTLAALPKRLPTAWDLSGTKPTTVRKLYFAQSEDEEHEGGTPDSDGINDDANARFYLFVGGYGTTAFDMNSPPNLVVHQGTVEDWIITNTTFEDHVFHIHQLHFQVLEINNQPVRDLMVRDTINVPHMSRSGPAPSVKLRMDFRGDNLVGTFVYQCHIASHEERGMMGKIQVQPRGQPSFVEIVTSTPAIPLRQPIIVTADVRPAGRSGAVPTGTVLFAIDGNIDGPPVAVSGGKATRAFTFYRPAVHTLTATYSGDAVYEAGQAQSVTIAPTAD